MSISETNDSLVEWKRVDVLPTWYRQLSSKQNWLFSGAGKPLLYQLCSIPSFMIDTFRLGIKNKDCRDGRILSGLVKKIAGLFGLWVQGRSHSLECHQGWEDSVEKWGEVWNKTNSGPVEGNQWTKLHHLHLKQALLTQHITPFFSPFPRPFFHKYFLRTCPVPTTLEMQGVEFFIEFAAQHERLIIQ